MKLFKIIVSLCLVISLLASCTVREFPQYQDDNPIDTKPTTDTDGNDTNTDNTNDNTATDGKKDNSETPTDDQPDISTNTDEHNNDNTHETGNNISPVDNYADVIYPEPIKYVEDRPADVLPAIYYPSNILTLTPYDSNWRVLINDPNNRLSVKDIERILKLNEGVLRLRYNRAVDLDEIDIKSEFYDLEAYKKIKEKGEQDKEKIEFGQPLCIHEDDEETMIVLSFVKHITETDYYEEIVLIGFIYTEGMWMIRGRAGTISNDKANTPFEFTLRDSDGMIIQYY